MRTALSCLFGSAVLDAYWKVVFQQNNLGEKIMVNPFIAKSKDYPHYKQRRHRVKYDLREKECYIRLSRLGYSINIIAKLFKRSTSAVHRRLSRSVFYIEKAGVLDLRKLPRQVREKAAHINHKTLLRLGRAWLMYAIGQEDKPPWLIIIAIPLIKS